jgi:hypothetical protein
MVTRLCGSSTSADQGGCWQAASCLWPPTPAAELLAATSFACNGRCEGRSWWCDSGGDERAGGAACRTACARWRRCVWLAVRLGIRVQVHPTGAHIPQHRAQLIALDVHAPSCSSHVIRLLRRGGACCASTVTSQCPAGRRGSQGARLLSMLVDASTCFLAETLRS